MYHFPACQSLVHRESSGNNCLTPTPAGLLCPDCLKQYRAFFSAVVIPEPAEQDERQADLCEVALTLIEGQGA